MKYNKFGFVLCALSVVALTGCETKNESAHHFDNKVYISAESFSSEVRIEKKVDKMSREIIVGMAMPEGYDVTVTFRAAPELLDTYRKAYYDPDALLLPESHYDLSQAEAVIKTAQIESEPLKLDFVNLEQLDLEERYVLPVTIESVNGLGVLHSAKTLYYIFKEASLVNVVADLNENCAWPDWEHFDEVADMNTFTMEALVFGYAFRNESSISTIMGIEDLFLIRVGDTTIPKNQLQIAYAAKKDDTTERGSVTGSSLALKTNRWYHIAVTFDHGKIKVYLDGREKASGDASAHMTSVNFKVKHSDESDNQPRCFWIGYSYDSKRFLNGMIGEARIWNKALTAEEIAAENHFYKVDPASEGLVAYWKFDDGKGAVVKDHSVYGNNLTVDHAPNWIAVELPEKTKK